MHQAGYAVGVVFAAWLLRTGVLGIRCMMSACGVVQPSVHVGQASKGPRARAKRQRQAEDQHGHQDLQLFAYSNHGHTMRFCQQESLIKIKIAARFTAQRPHDWTSAMARRPIQGPLSPCFSPSSRASPRKQHSTGSGAKNRDPTPVDREPGRRYEKPRNSRHPLGFVSPKLSPNEQGASAGTLTP